MSIDKSKQILVTRAAGGVGDVLCSTVAMRSAKEKYGPLGFKVYGAVGRTVWRDWLVDQDICDGILECEWCRMNPEAIREKFIHHYSLDGPEENYQKETRWNIQRPRVETWCLSCDCRPTDMRPRWKPTAEETAWASEYLWGRDLAPKDVVVLQWSPASGMFFKIYRHRLKLAMLLAEQYPVLVLHRFEPNDPPDQDWEKLMELQHPRLRPECSLSLRQVGAVLSLARFGVGPDSSLLHFAAAVDLPWLGIFGPTSGEVICRHYPLAKFIQARIDPNWICAKTSPCNGVNERNFWCHDVTPSLGGDCLGQLQPETIVAECAKLIERKNEHDLPEVS